MGDVRYPLCEGCDSQGWEAEQPDWPCQTARLLYGSEETEAVKNATEAAWEQWRRERDTERARRESVEAVERARVSEEVRQRINNRFAR